MINHKKINYLKIKYLGVYMLMENLLGYFNMILNKTIHKHLVINS